jgi:hypothetical protein
MRAGTFYIAVCQKALFFCIKPLLGGLADDEATFVEAEEKLLRKGRVVRSGGTAEVIKLNMQAIKALFYLCMIPVYDIPGSNPF